jgi:hypothetical protein
MPPVAHVLRDETITVGRMKGNTVVVDDVSVSLSHARITRKDGEFYLKDLNSTNGTRVNGQPISEAKLHDRDLVKFANIQGHFVADDSAVVMAPGVTATSAPAPASPAPVAIPSQTSLTVPVPSAASHPSPATTIPSRPASVPNGVTPNAPAAPISKPVDAPRPRSSRKPVLSFSRFLGLLVPTLGGAVAVTVFSVIGWKMFHPQDGMTRGITASASTPADTRSEPAKLPAPRAIPQPPASPAAPSKTLAPGTIEPVINVDTESLPKLIRDLSAPDVAERRRAATSLHSMGTDAKVAVPALRKALNDSDDEVKLWAALCLVNNQAYDNATIPILVQALQRDDAMLRQVVCLSLGLIPYDGVDKDPVVAALSVTASKDADEEVRQAAKSALNILAPDTLAKATAK